MESFELYRERTHMGERESGKESVRRRIPFPKGKVPLNRKKSISGEYAFIPPFRPNAPVEPIFAAKWEIRTGRPVRVIFPIKESSTFSSCEHHQVEKVMSRLNLLFDLLHRCPSPDGTSLRFPSDLFESSLQFNQSLDLLGLQSTSRSSLFHAILRVFFF